MKIVYSPEELDNAIELTQQESAAAFGDSTVYLEKFLESPRHIEVQVLADRTWEYSSSWRQRLFATEKAPESNRRSSCNGYQKKKKGRRSTLNV
jgi:hypothetical protein